MRSSRDACIYQRADVGQIPQRQRLSFCGCTEGHLDHLVEVTVIERTVVADADDRSAHQVGDGARIEVVDEESHVLVEPAPLVKLMGKAIDRHVGDREQAAEANPEVSAELIAVLRFEFSLRWRQRRTNGIVNEIEREFRAAITDPAILWA
jgi:hypothetical protein